MPPLIGFSAVLVVFIAVRAAITPATERQVERFIARHNLQSGDGHRAYIASYLSRTRRYRVLGVAGAFLACLVVAVPRDHLTVPFSVLLAGWFVGAVLAELSLPAPGGRPVGAVPVPRWLLRVPSALAALAVAVTASTVALAAGQGSASRMIIWGIGALACAWAVAVANRHALSRVVGGSQDDGSRTAEPGAVVPGGGPEADAVPGCGPEAGGADRATAAAAIGAITGIGSLLVVLCLTHEAGLITDRFVDHVGKAAAGIQLLWNFGAVLVAALLVAAARPVGTGSASWRLRRYQVLGVVAALTVISAWWSGYAAWQDHPPYGPGAIGATARLQFTDEAHFAADSTQLGVAGLHSMIDGPGKQQFVARVDYRLPKDRAAGGYFYVFAVDRRGNRPASIFGVHGGTGGSLFDTLPQRYPWLSALTPDDHGRGPGAVAGPAGAAGPITFNGTFFDVSGLTAADVMVALVYVGPDEQIYWATQVPMAA